MALNPGCGDKVDKKARKLVTCKGLEVLQGLASKSDRELQKACQENL